MIRQAAFTGKMPLLKGALHCHTTRSGGKGTPEATTISRTSRLKPD